MRSLYFFAVFAFYQIVVLAYNNNSQPLFDREEYLSANRNNFISDQNSVIIKFLEFNPTSEQINEFILNKYFKVEDYYLQSGYTALNWNGSDWINTMRLSINFTQNGDEELSVYENWDGSNWVYDKKYESVYNQNNKIQVYTYSLYSSGQWQLQYKLEFEYPDNTSMISTRYDFINSAWQNVSRDLYTYDSNNNLIEKISQQWSGTQWLNSTQNVYSYDLNNNLTSVLFTYWDNGLWVNNQKYIYSYNQLNNMTEFLYQKWVSADWLNQFRYTYSYNSNNLLDNNLKQNWDNNSWINQDRSFYNYDQLGNRIQTFRELWTNNSWVSFQQTTYTYNDTLLIHYKLSEYDGSQWNNKNQTSISYDSNGNKDTEIYQSWFNNDWQNVNKYIFTHTLITDAETYTNTINNFKLNQNYPNPFNPSTKISWQSPVSSYQTLKVYDLLGNEVATLVNEYKPAGSYEVEFSIGSFGDASNLSSGTYFYRLTAGEFSETKKLIVIK